MSANGRARNGHGSATGWAGTWGPMGDGRSKLARLARRIERELLEVYVAATPLAARLVRAAARLSAMSEMTLLGVGQDAKCTRRGASALSAAAEKQLARLEKIAKPRPAPDPLADYYAKKAKEDA
jgi:hypothetical protein